MKFSTILLFCICCVYSSGWGQIKVEGKVIDAGSKAPVQGARIWEVDNEENQTSTDENGDFLLRISNNQIAIDYAQYGGPEYYFIDKYHSESIIFTLPRLSVNIEPIEVIGNYNPQGNITIPSLVQLSKPQLLISDEISIAPALNLIPGVFMHSGALNTNRITIRGIGNRSPFATAKVRAYLDEIPLTNGVGETTIEDLDLSFIQQVAVLKGPAASLYGAGLGGVIQLSTLPSKYKADNKFSLGSTFGAYGLNRQTVQLDFGESQDYQLHLNYNRTHSDGYRDNNEYDRSSLVAFGKFYLNEKNEFSFFVNHTQLKAFIPSSLNFDDFTNNPRKAAFTWKQVMGFEDYGKTLLGLSYKATLAKNWQWSNSLFTNFRNAYESRPFNILREQNYALGGRSSLSYLGISTDNISGSLKLGVEYFTENYDWQTNGTDGGTLRELLSDNEERRFYTNVFLQSEWEIYQNTSITAGFNFNNTGYDYTDRFLTDGQDQSGRFEFDNILSPYLSVQHLIREKSIWIDNLNLFAVLGHGFSPPTLEETLTPDGSKNPDIQPERGWNVEWGSSGLLFHRFSYSFSFYQMYIKDLLVARRTALDQFESVNAGRTKHQGLELSLNYEVAGSVLTANFFTHYHYANYRFTEFVDGEDDFSGNELTGTAPHTFSAGVDTRWKPVGLYAHIDFRHLDAMPIRDDNSIYSDPYQLLNFKVGWEKTFAGRWGLDIYGGINNLSDEKYASMILINAGSFGGAAPRYYYPGLPRNGYAGLRLVYKW